MGVAFLVDCSLRINVNANSREFYININLQRYIRKDFGDVRLFIIRPTNNHACYMCR